MNPDQENFEALRKLLTLKKYEQPPPRYFSELPHQIWTRIEREAVEVPFWERFFPNFRLSPSFAYGLGLLACGTFVFGIGYSLSNEAVETAVRPIPDNKWEALSSKNETSDGLGLKLSNFQPTQMASTNPVMNSDPLPSLFGNPQLRIAPVSFSPAQ